MGPGKEESWEETQGEKAESARAQEPQACGGPVRGPEPKKKPRKKKAQKAPKRTAASKKIEEILVPGLNPKRGDMKSFLEAQRRLYA